MPSQSASIRDTLTLSDRLPGRAGEEAARPGSAVAVKRKRRPIWLSFIGDTIAIAIVLAAINHYLFPSDPCWLHSNPTPLLLLPLLIGGRYGGVAGLASGIFASGSILGVMYLLGTDPSQLLATNAMMLISMPLIGLLCGEIHSYFKVKTRRLDDRCRLLEEIHGRASTNLELYADSNFDLQRRLATYGVRFTSLDSELRRILGPATTDLYAESLALLKRVSDISEAAIYEFKGLNLRRGALLGDGAELPEELRVGMVGIVDQAITEKKMVTCRELSDETPQLYSRHLAAIPWIAPHGKIIAVLLIGRLPFHCATWQNFAQIESICDWISQYAHIKNDTGSQSGARDFDEIATLCIATHRKHSLPSSAAFFIAKEASPLTQEQLEDAIAPLLRATDVTKQLDDQDRANLAVLLPMDGSREAEKLAALLADALPAEPEANITQTREHDSTRSFLSRLSEGD